MASYVHELISGNDIAVPAAQRTTAGSVNVDWSVNLLAFGPDGGPFTLVTSSAGLPVDTELPAAAALADAASNPTTTILGAYLFGWNSGASQWNRLRAATATGLEVNVKAGTVQTIAPAPATLLNLASASHGADYASADLTLTNYSTLSVLFNITAVTGGTTLTIYFDVKGADGIWYNVYTSAGLTGTGSTVTSIGPGCVNTHVLTDTGRLQAKLTGGAGPYTYSASVIGR